MVIFRIMKKFIYALYDLANSSYSAIVITFVISTYFARQIVGDIQLGAAYWQWTAGLCGLLIAISSPLLGEIADRKKKWTDLFFAIVYVFMFIFNLSFLVFKT